MNLIKEIGVGDKCAETGFGTEQNRPPAIGGARIVLWIRVSKDSPTQGHERFMFFTLGWSFRHLN